MIAHLDQLWAQLIDTTSKLLIPDWGALVNLLPLFILIGVVGPLLSLIVLVWFVYFLRRPRTRVRIEEGPRPIEVGTGGELVYPAGEPYCVRDRLAFAPGTTRCDVCQEPLVVRCPMCGVGREAAISTCGNCGLVLKVERRVRVMRPSGPPPGGAAVA